MTSLFKPETRAKLLKEVRSKGSGTHYMVLTDQAESLRSAISEVGLVVKEQDQLGAQIVRITRRNANWKERFAALVEFFTPGEDGEMLVWRGTKVPLQAHNEFVKQCQVLIDGDDVGNTEGRYPVVVISAMS